MLDMIRPDFLLLRVLSRNIILWDEIVPSREWIDLQLPIVIRKIAVMSGDDGAQLLSSIRYIWPCKSKQDRKNYQLSAEFVFRITIGLHFSAVRFHSFIDINMKLFCVLA